MHWQGLLRRSGTASLACSLVLAAGAAADPPTYHSGSSTIISGQTNQDRSGCPVGPSDIVGGGTFMSGSSLETEVKSSLPLDDNSDGDKQPDNYWIGEANAGPSNETITVYSICSQRNVAYKASKERIKPGQTLSLKARCSDDRKVISGGAGASTTTSTSVRLMASAPSGIREWTGRIVNGSSERLKMKVWAVCADVKRKVRRSEDATATFPNGTQQAIETLTSCPAGYDVTGLGAAVLGNPAGVEIASLIPTDKNSDMRPDDGAKAWFNNESGVSRRRSVTAVCAKL